MLVADISKTFGEFGPVPVEVFRAGHPPLEDLPQKKYYIVLKHLSGLTDSYGGGPRVVVSTAAFPARVRGSVPGLGGLKQKMFLPHPRVKVSIVGSLRD